MIVIGTFRGSKTVVVLNSEEGYIIQKENFKSSQNISLYTVSSGMFTKDNIHVLFCTAYDKVFFENLETFVTMNENWAGSITGTRDEMLDEFRREPEVLVALDLFIDSTMNFDRQEVVSL